MAIVYPTNHPKSVRNRYVFESFSDIFVFLLCVEESSHGIGAFANVITQISSIANQAFKAL